MRNLTIYLTLFLCLFFNKIIAQETFEDRAKLIATKIEQITKEEKSALKWEVEAVNTQLQSGLITNQQADEKKMQLAEIRAKNIETRINSVQEELKALVQEKVDGKIKERDSTKRYSFSIPPMKIKDHHKDKTQGEKRTTTQFVLAFGVNNLATDGSIANSEFKYWCSQFFEWGFTGNTRLFKNENLLHLKYGFSIMYNNLRPTDNRVFVPNGSQTNLEEYPLHLEDARFKNVYIVAPLHLEFDFSGNKSKKGKSVFKTHESIRLGIGGYAGFRIKSKQKICYEINDSDVREKTKGDFNANDFIYGVSTYIGYKATSLYLKYDLNPLFKDNIIKQNNISLGLRFDFN